MKRILMTIMAVAVAVTFSAPTFAEEKKEEKKGKFIEQTYAEKKEEKKGGQVDIFGDEKKDEKKDGK